MQIVSYGGDPGGGAIWPQDRLGFHWSKDVGSISRSGR